MPPIYGSQSNSKGHQPPPLLDRSYFLRVLARAARPRKKPPNIDASFTFPEVKRYKRAAPKRSMTVKAFHESDFSCLCILVFREMISSSIL